MVLPSVDVLFKLMVQAGPYGVLVVIILCFIFGWISPKSVVDKQDATIQELKSDLKRLNTELEIWQRIGSIGAGHAEELVAIAKATHREQANRPQPDE